MEKKYWWVAGAIIVVVILLVVLSVLTPPLPAGNAGPGPGAGYGQAPGAGPVSAGSPPLLLPRADPAPLSESEAADILFLREEEQLAHDLYTRWAMQYTIPVFSNIAASEATHLAAVQLLIDRYAIPGRIGNASAGYSDPALQALYHDLRAKGDASLTGALEAGLAIEEKDIADIDRFSANTTRTDIRQVYASLRMGSESHKSAFLRQLGR